MQDKEALAGKYVARLRRCLLAVKILIIFTVAAIAALIIFALAAKGSGLKDSNPAATFITALSVGCTAAAAAITALAILLLSRITLSKLKKLGGEGDN